MKRLITIVIFLILSLSLCACGKTSKPEPTETQSNPIFVVATPSSSQEAEITYEQPVVILDNEYVKITVSGKYAGRDDTTIYEVYGYKTVIENKMQDKYINININDINIDGYMLDHQAGLYATIQNVAPNAKANSRFYLYLERAKSVEMKSIEDLKNVTGIIQISFSDDGASYSLGSGPNGERPFNNKFSFEHPLP